MKLYESGENYLEQILILSKTNSQIRQADIGSALQFSRATVSVMLRDLAKAGYVNISKDGYITLTEKGLGIAKPLYEKHNILAKFFIHLGTPGDIAIADACKIEHDISDITFSKIKEYCQKYCND